MKITNKPKPGFWAALKDNGVLELTVYEEIGADWFGEGVTAKSVKQEIESSGTFSRIAVRINSPGGDAFEGIAIHSLLRSQNKPIEVFVDGIAASAASIVAMSGDTITMTPGAMMMVHDAWSICMGNDEDMRKMADTLEKVSDSIAQVYVSRTGKDLEYVRALMDAETWMSAEDCVKDGFATTITQHEDRSAMALAASFKSLAKLKNVPEQLKSGARDDMECECSCEACQMGDDAECSMPGCTDPNCIDCPMQELANDSAKDSNLSQYEARLKMLKVA